MNGSANPSHRSCNKQSLYDGRTAGTQLNVVVVGCGIGGLACAFSLLKAGHKVTILETARSIGEVSLVFSLLAFSMSVECATHEDWSGHTGYTEPLAYTHQVGTQRKAGCLGYVLLDSHRNETFVLLKQYPTAVIPEAIVFRRCKFISIIFKNTY